MLSRFWATHFVFVFFLSHQNNYVQHWIQVQVKDKISIELHCMHRVNIILPSAARELNFLWGCCQVVTISSITSNPLTLDTGAPGLHAQPSPSSTWMHSHTQLQHHRHQVRTSFTLLLHFESCGIKQFTCITCNVMWQYDFDSDSDSVIFTTFEVFFIFHSGYISTSKYH